MPTPAEDGTVADRVRSELGPLLKQLDQPHVHVQVVDGIATLHGDVTDAAAGTAVEARALAVAGVRGLRSRLHIGLLRSDTLPSYGRAHHRSALFSDLLAAGTRCGFASRAQSRYAITAALGCLAWLLPPRARRRLRDHLPDDVRRLLRPLPWLREDRRSVRRVHELAQIVAIAAASDNRHAERLVREVLPLVRRSAASDARSIARALPHEIAAIWVGDVTRDQ